MEEQIPPVVEEPEKKKNNTVLIIAIVAIIVICCCCIGLWAAYYLGDCITTPNDPSICPLASTAINLI